VSQATELLEISDEIVSFDPLTLARVPVSQKEAVARFRAAGDEKGARYVETLPCKPDDTLDSQAVDTLLVRVHCEMQRLSEEFEHGARVASLLRPLLNTLRQVGAVSSGKLRIVDIGCGTGYVLRWLAACGELGDDVELIGVDFNPALIAEAQRLAERENLSCHFTVANAFKLAQPGAVYLSTGVLHHFRGQEALTAFFAEHNHPATFGFLHFDFQPSVFAGPGAWLFHVLRMREPLARHDGVVSALRVHEGALLVKAARSGASELMAGIYGARLYRTPIPRVFHTLVGYAPTFETPTWQS
jgi:SAM-dependent methyltransferase